MPSSVPAVKTGLAAFLRSTDGLRPSDGVTIRRADPEPAQFKLQMVVLGSATAPQVQPGYGHRREETVTMTCWVFVTKPGVGDTAEQAVADRAYELLALIEGALAADRTAAGAVPPPGQLAVTSTALEELPVDWDGSAARRAQLSFSLSWTSDIA